MSAEARRNATSDGSQYNLELMDLKILLHHPCLGSTATDLYKLLTPLPPHRLTTVEQWGDHHLLEANMERKLTALLSADVQGYSRLMGEDEEATIRTLTAYREVMATLIAQHRGRVVDSPGDNLLAEFVSAVDAVRCAVEIQRDLQVKNAALPPERRMEFRIGINVGDVVVEGERLYGDGVNIAARLEALAEGGDICIAGTVYDQVENKLSLGYEYVGEQIVKNIAKPVRVYRVRTEAEAPATEPGKDKVTSPLQTSTLPLPDKPSIIVLPFVNMSNDPEQGYFSDGITEDITTDLSKISSLFVISRNSAFTYKGKAAKVRDISREMGVRYVMEGSVRKAGERIRITAQLIDATTDHHLWSERYDRPLHDIFALQDEIVQKIVTTLRLQVTLQEQGYIVRKHTNNLEAYDSFLRGVEYGWRLTKDENARARQMFEKAVALDPQYAEAYTWLGWTHLLEWMNSWSADPQTLERALALEQQALALDDSLPGAHSLLGFVYAQQQQYEQAIAEGERAIALDPNNADSYAFHGEVLRFAGRPEDTLRMLEQAMRLNPRYPPFYVFFLGLAYNQTGRNTEAVAMLKAHISRSPTNLAAHLFLALSCMQQWASQQSANAQMLEQAVAAQRAIASAESTPSWGHTIWGSVYLWQKQYEPALVEMERAIALRPNDALGYASLAETLSRVGRPEEAIVMAEQALRQKPINVDVHLSSVGVAYDLAGRPEEAIAPLKQYLARYPNVLGAHLTLAAVYSELGREVEARVEAAEVLRLNPQFSLEIYKQRVPIKDPAALERHIATLGKAGLK
jgi:adenylate cyclase